MVPSGLMREGMLYAIGEHIDLLKEQAKKLADQYYETRGVLEWKIQALKEQRAELERLLQKGR